MEDKSTVLLTGDIPFALRQGALHLGDDSLPSLLRAWPELLAAAAALGAPYIYVLKNGKIKTIADPHKSLKSFICYYLKCSEALSPLLPDWADALLRKGPEAFERETQYEDPVVEWLLPRIAPFEPELLFQEWSWLKEVFQDLIALYPSRSQKEAHETV